MGSGGSAYSVSQNGFVEPAAQRQAWRPTDAWLDNAPRQPKRRYVIPYAVNGRACGYLSVLAIGPDEALAEATRIHFGSVTLWRMGAGQRGRSKTHKLTITQKRAITYGEPVEVLLETTLAEVRAFGGPARVRSAAGREWI